MAKTKCTTTTTYGAKPLPKASSKPCAKPGCGTLVDRANRYCDPHGGKHNWLEFQQGQTKEQRGRTSRSKWRKFRKRKMAEANYLCAECLRDGIHKAGKELDHIIPIAQGGEEFADDNIQLLCIQHHRSKTARERFNNA